jgi:hypothetical protein
MLTINMVGTGLCTALLPMTLQSARPVLLTWITLTVSGEYLANSHAPIWLSLCRTHHYCSWYCVRRHVPRVAHPSAPRPQATLAAGRRRACCGKPNNWNRSHAELSPGYVDDPIPGVTLRLAQRILPVRSWQSALCSPVEFCRGRQSNCTRIGGIITETEHVWRSHDSNHSASKGRR